jgi:D-sedoheptulose 7-phosphate isomerase
MDIKNFVDGYLDDVRALLDGIDRAAVGHVVDALLEVWRRGGRLLLMGNGGSSSSVSHIVNDMQKNIFLETGRPLRALCLSDSTPLLMAWANDTEWANVFAPPVECWAEPGDVVVGVSGSGNSMNVINGIEAAKCAGASTIGLAGFSGGKLRGAAERCLVVNSENMQRIEDVHMILLHIVFSAVLEQARLEAVAR